MLSPKTEQKQSTRPQDKRPLFEENSVLSGLSAPSTFSSLWPFCVNSFLNLSITKSRNPATLQWLVSLQDEHVGQGLLQETGSTFKPNIQFAPEACGAKTLSWMWTWTHAEKNEYIFFFLSNRKAYKASSPLSNIQRQLVFTAKVMILKLLRKRKEVDYRPPRKAAASRRSTSLCYCLSVPCDPLEQSDTQNWFSPFSGLCFRDPRNINFRKLFWRTIIQCRFNWNRQ